MLFYDVCEEIDLDRVRALVGAGGAERRPDFRRPAPEYVRFTRPPVVRNAGSVRLSTGEEWRCLAKFYDYGVVTVTLELPFAADWPELVQLSGRWIASPEIEQKAMEIARAEVNAVRRALVNPYETWSTEDYYAFHVAEAHDADGAPLTASDLLGRHGGEIVQMVRGETTALSDSEVTEVLSRWLSYYPSDLFVVAWMAAFVRDTPEGATPMLQLLEYSNTQLLEFRYYDGVLTTVLDDVHRRLEHRRGILGRWRMGSEAERLNRIRLDVIELTERVDNSIKFLSDMFYARAYRLASSRVGVPDYRDLVDEKLKTAGELYESMIAEFHQVRGFLLEVMVVAILIIELVFLFRGKG
jgi:hypothetical protein